MNPERLNRLMNTLLAAKIAADQLDSVPDVNFQRRFRLQRDLSGLIEQVERWQREAVHLAKFS